MNIKIDKELYIKQHGVKKYREYCKQNRVLSGMNTGTLVMKDSTVYSRKVKHKNKDAELKHW